MELTDEIRSWMNHPSAEALTNELGFQVVKQDTEADDDYQIQFFSIDEDGKRNVRSVRPVSRPMFDLYRMLLRLGESYDGLVWFLREADGSGPKGSPGEEVHAGETAPRPVSQND